MFYTKDKHMNWPLYKLVLSLFSLEIQNTFGEEMMANPNMKFTDISQSFKDTYGQVIEEEVEDNTARLTAD